jgi:hypothetical protein
MKCILCKSEAVAGLKYCPPHYARAQRQTLAEKLAEAKAAGYGIDQALPGFEGIEEERAEKAGAIFEMPAEQITLF